MNKISTVLLLAIVVFAACSSPDVSIEEFRSLTRDVDRFTVALHDRQAEMQDLVGAYNQTVPKNRRLELEICPSAGLCENSREALQRQIDSEDDESCLEILNRAWECDNEIRELTEELGSITGQLPKPHIVKDGENHYLLCVNFLTETCRLDRGAADSLIARVALNSDIIQGFHIWFVYESGKFGTYVTQGSAKVSPTVFAKEVRRHQVKRAREEGREEAYTRILDSLKQCGAFTASTSRLR